MSVLTSSIASGISKHTISVHALYTAVLYKCFVLPCAPPLPLLVLPQPFGYTLIEFVCSSKVTGTAWTPRRSPRVSLYENFPVESSEAKGCGSTDANTVLASSLPANASSLVEKAALSTVSITVCDSPSQDERDVLMSKKVRRSYSRLDASPSLNMSTPTFAHGLQKKCSLFGFEKLLVPDALADVSPVGKVSPAQKTPVEPDALGSTKEWDTNIPGISFPKEKRKKRRIPQIDVSTACLDGRPQGNSSITQKSELDEWAAQMNAQFEEAEQFDLVVE
uniref:Sororin n=1 Tax=Chelonoidis abingdonii TaxID=106734 RepID=A0A8C0JBL0_CHEAB